MKLVLVGPVYPYRGGIAHYTTMLARALQERGHDLLLISFKRQYPQWLFPGSSDLDPSKDALEAPDAQYWLDSLNPLSWLATFWRFCQYEPDVVLLQWWVPFWAPLWFTLGLLNRLFTQCPIVFICHNVLPHEAGKVDAILARLALQWGFHFIVHSQEEHRRLTSILSNASVSVLALPVFDILAEDRTSKKEARDQLGLPHNQPVLLFFGIVRKYKGLDVLLAALPEIQRQVGKVTLLIAGEFWHDKSFYLEMVERLGVSQLLVVKDHYIPNEEVSLYFSAADVVVAPYRRVTGSGVVRMAQGFARPVVTTHVGEMVDWVVDGEEGLLVPPADSVALANAIVRLFSEDLIAAITASLELHPPRAQWVDLFDVIEGLGDYHSGRRSDFGHRERKHSEGG